MQDLMPEQLKEIERIKGLWAETPLSVTEADGPWLQKLRYYYFTCASDVSMRLAAMKLDIEAKRTGSFEASFPEEYDRIDKELRVCHEIGSFFFNHCHLEETISRS